MNTATQLEIPVNYTNWRLDQIAECLSVKNETYIVLWETLNGCVNPHPVGGDGSDGTIETPEVHESDDTLEANWQKLRPHIQLDIIAACEKEDSVYASIFEDGNLM